MGCEFARKFTNSGTLTLLLGEWVDTYWGVSTPITLKIHPSCYLFYTSLKLKPHYTFLDFDLRVGQKSEGVSKFSEKSFSSPVFSMFVCTLVSFVMLGFCGKLSSYLNIFNIKCV